MMNARPRRNEMTEDRLWDDHGDEWTNRPSSPLTGKEIRALLRRGRPVALLSNGELSWIPGDRTLAFWSTIKGYLETPDADGLTYSVELWRRGDRRLVGVRVHC